MQNVAAIRPEDVKLRLKASERFAAQHKEWAEWPKQFHGTGAVFNIHCDPNMGVHGFQYGHPLALDIDPAYRPNRKLLPIFNAFFLVQRKRGLWIGGPPGAGKTYEISQIAARYGWPVLAFSWGSKKEVEDLFGYWQIVDGESVFIHGPLALAMKIGALLLINEIDRGDPGDLVALNDVLEGGRLILPTNGNEVIRPHPNFRIAFTANSGGQGDKIGGLNTVRQQDQSVLTRSDCVWVGYPTFDEEIDRVLETFPHLKGSLPLVQGAVKLANETRTLFMDGGDAGQQISAPISPREVLSWMENTWMFNGAPVSPIRLGLELAYLNRLTDEEAKAVTTLAEGIFGPPWNVSA